MLLIDRKVIIMNKILFNFLVIGVSLAGIQGASGMEPKADSQDNYKKRLRSHSGHNKENINTNNFNVEKKKKSRINRVKPSISFKNSQDNQFELSTIYAKDKEWEHMLENSFFLQSHNSFELTIDLNELEFLLNDL